MHQLGDDRLGLQIIVAIGFVRCIPHRAVEAFHDAVSLRVPRLTNSPPGGHVRIEKSGKTAVIRVRLVDTVDGIEPRHRYIGPIQLQTSRYLRPSVSIFQSQYHADCEIRVIDP